MVRSPLVLEFLLHCYYSPSPHPRIGTPIYIEAKEYLLSNEMVEPCDNHFVCTKKGKFFVEFILTVPFPDVTFIIPGTSISVDKVAETFRDSGVALGDLIKGKRRP